MSSVSQCSLRPASVSSTTRQQNGAVRARLAVRPPVLPLRTGAGCNSQRRGGLLKAAAQVGQAQQSQEWSSQWMALNDAEVKSILPEEAMRLVTAGKAIIVDVRKEEDYVKGHAIDSVNIPLFKKLNPLESDFKGFIKFAVYAVNGVSAVSLNNNFVDEVAAAADGKATIFYCEAGGMLEPTPNFMYGKESRSLKACYKALMDGRTKPYHLSGGLYQWYQDGFEMVGEFDKSNLGRTPNAAGMGTIDDAMKK